MVLTWPIDVKPVDEIPAFANIIEEHPGCEPMIRYLCYRFDPKCIQVREAIDIDSRHEIAQRMAGMTCPIPEVAFIDDDGAVHFSDEWKTFSAVSNMFFPLLNNPEWEFLKSLEIAMDEGNAILREPIPADLEVEVKAKSQLLKINTAKGCMDMLKMRKDLLAELVDGNGDVRGAIVDKTSERKSGSRIKRDITGKPQ